MIDLSEVKSDFHEGRGHTKYHSHRNHNEKDSLVCAYCNQLYKKGDHRAQTNFIYNHFQRRENLVLYYSTV